MIRYREEKDKLFSCWNIMCEKCSFLWDDDIIREDLSLDKSEGCILGQYEGKDGFCGVFLFELKDITLFYKYTTYLHPNIHQRSIQFHGN